MNSVTVDRIAVPFSVLLVAIYALVIHIWARNIPFNDDILDILQFFLRLAESGTLSERLDAFLAPHTDHRTTASRLIYVLAYQIQGEINFITLTYIANASLLGMLFLFRSQLQELERNGLLLLCIALLLFQPRAFGPMFCVMCGFAFFYVNVYALASLILLARPRPANFLLALVCAVLSNLSLASGQLLWPIGLAWLIYLRWRDPRLPAAYPLLWLMAGIITIFLYRFGWDTVNTPAALVDMFNERPLFAIHFALTILGSALGFGSALVAEICGTIMLLALCWLTLRGLRGGLSPMHAYAWFVVAQCMAMTMGRAPYAAASENPMFFAMVPRYSFTSICLVVSLVLLAIPAEPRVRRLWSLAATGSAAAFALASYLVYIPEVQAHWEHRLKFYNNGQFRVLGTPMKESNAIVQRSVEAGMYHPPPPPLTAGPGW